MRKVATNIIFGLWLMLLVLILLAMTGCSYPFNHLVYKKYRLWDGRIVYCKTQTETGGSTKLSNCKDGSIYVSQTNITFLGKEND